MSGNSIAPQEPKLLVSGTKKGQGLKGSELLVTRTSGKTGLKFYPIGCLNLRFAPECALKLSSGSLRGMAEAGLDDQRKQRASALTYDYST